MNKISEGYFYDVYDIGNGRVLKKKRSFSDISKSIKGKTADSPLSNWFKTFKYIRGVKKTTSTINKKISSIPQELIGNPTFINKTDYEQDKVTLLMDYFQTHSLSENKLIIDKYTDLIKEFLKYGIHDYVYKFKNSYGVNEKGNVVFIDFNEVVFSKEKIMQFIEKKQWQNEAQYRKFEEGELKSYLGLKLGETLTVDVVDRLFGSHTQS